MKTKIYYLYPLIVGICMILMWLMLLITKQVPELKTELGAILFHVMAEFLTASLLIISGLALLKKHKLKTPLYCLSMGALLYTGINSMGYYITYFDLSMLIMFSIIIISTISITILYIKNEA